MGGETSVEVRIICGKRHHRRHYHNNYEEYCRGKEGKNIRGSRVSFNTHKLLNNEGTTMETIRPITCDSLHELLDPKKYDLDMICGEIATVGPMDINNLFLHTSMTGVLHLTNVNRHKSPDDPVVSVHI